MHINMGLTALRLYLWGGSHLSLAQPLRNDFSFQHQESIVEKCGKASRRPVLSVRWDVDYMAREKWK